MRVEKSIALDMQNFLEGLVAERYYEKEEVTVVQKCLSEMGRNRGERGNRDRAKLHVVV